MPRRRPPTQEPPRLRPVAGVAPPHNLDAERAVLSACLLVGAKADVVQLEERDFFAQHHGWVWSAIAELRAEGRAIDLISVGQRLLENGRLNAVGGTPYLSEIIDATPAVSNVLDHAEIVRTLAARRDFIVRTHEITARLYDPSTPATFEAEALRTLSDTTRTRVGSAIDESWGSLTLEHLTVPPAPRRWLLRHPTIDGEDCAPGTGDGMLPMGKAGLLSAEGGAGKTLALCQLAVSVAIGCRWLGHYDVGEEARGGRVLLALAEEDIEEVQRRLFAVCESLRLSEYDRRRIVELVTVLPLAGKPVAIVAPTPEGRVDETDELRAMRRRLEACRTRPCGRCGVQGKADVCVCGASRPKVHGWSLVVLDPLARWAGADTETDNSAATRFVQAAESLTSAPGGPTVLIAHHSSKDARKQGKADARGVTAITDGFRWAGEMRSLSADVMFKQAKSNYSRPWSGDELRLVRAKGGVLRIPSAEELGREEHFQEEREAERERRAQETQERAIAAAMAAVTTALEKTGPVASRSAIVDLVGGKKATMQAAITRLITAGRVSKSGEGYVVAPARAAAETKPGTEGEADAQLPL